MKNKKIVALSCAIVASLVISTIAFTVMQGRSQAITALTEPTSLSELINYPGTANLRPLSEEEIETEIIQLELTGMLRGIPLKGYHDTRQTLMAKGYVFSDSFFDVFIDDVYLETPDGLEIYTGATYMQWSEMGPNGTKALLTGAVMRNMITSEESSTILGVPTNVLPPEEMPGVDPYIIWNAEPYFYIQFYWWRPWPYQPYWRCIYWKYWWYDSHKSPNWFWGPYWWWRTYLKVDGLPWYPWYWWWWHWYYWRGWYWWSTYWPY